MLAAAFNCSYSEEMTTGKPELLSQKLFSMNDRLLPFLTIFAISCLSPSLFSQENRPERQVLTVSATGTERIEATVAEVRLAIEERGMTDEEARNRMAKHTNNLLAYLREENVERLETTSLRLHPIYDYTKGDREIVGFQARSVIQFRTAVDQISQIIDESISRGANQVQDLVFTAPESEIEAARQRALRTATRLALERADAVLAELGLERRQIIRINLAPLEPEPPIPLPRMEAQVFSAKEERSPTDVEAGQPTITASVTLELAY